MTIVIGRIWDVNMVAIGLVITNLLQYKIRNGILPYAGVYLGLVTMGLVSIFKIS